MNKINVFFSVIFVLATLGFTNCSGAPGGSSTNASSGSNSNSGGITGSGAVTGAQYFANNVLPVFDAKCMTCHNDPRFGGQGPLTIYSYSAMKNMLSTGPSSVNNNLVNKMQNIISHGGGNVCPQGVTASPCIDVVNWWQKEFTSSASGIIGAILSVDPFGKVSGWAQDSKNLTSTITVYFYVDGGPTSGGTSAGSVAANQAGSGVNAGHFFNYTLPAQFNDGKAHSLYAYGSAATDANLLPGAPQAFTSYTPKQAGMDYYNTTVKPLLDNKCSQCHQVDYTSDYYNLISPPPSAGGTATNNLMINKPSGQVSHGGGNICGGVNGSPCAQIQQWWTLEFN